MDAVLRAASIYVALLVLFRLAGRRSLAEITPFDLILLLIIGEATQQALLGDDFSITNSILVISTLVTIDIGLSMLKLRSRTVARWLDGTPTLVVENGRPLRARLAEARLQEDDILQAARQGQGLERMDQIKYAILEPNGKISIIPYSYGTWSAKACQCQPRLPRLNRWRVPHCAAREPRRDCAARLRTDVAPPF
jgi:uncharacterized membrane protein YcaP (DUF421 family)